jgi:hypothetical protein
MHLSKRIFARRFAHGGLRWARKIRYFPAYGVQASALLLSLSFSAVGLSALARFWIFAGLSRFPVPVADYLPWLLSIGIVILGFQLTMMCVARKVMVCEGKLWVKTIGYWSFTYPLGAMRSVRLMHPLRLLFSPRLLYRTKFRFFYYFDIKFWKPGLLVELSDGRLIFLSLTSPERAIEELREFFPAQGRETANQSPESRAA